MSTSRMTERTSGYEYIKESEEQKMKETIRVLLKRQEQLKTVLNKLDSVMKNLPDGRLRICDRRVGAPQYYHVDRQEGGSHIYLKDKDIKLVKALANKAYLVKLERECREELLAIERALLILRKGDPEGVYSNLHPARRELVKPLMLTDDEFVRRWEAYEYEESDFHPEEKKFSTKKGDLVRSKSEAMIADMYYDLGIPYKYEFPLTMKSGTTYYVDFACLRISDRTVLYHEHFGKMDDPGYVRRNMKKIDEYMKNGIFDGKNLILTMESEGYPVNMKVLRKNTIDIFGC